MKCLTFQKPNKYHFLFLLFFVSALSRLFVNDKVMVSGNRKVDFFFLMHSYILSHILSFIPFFISQYLSKKKEKSDMNKLVENIVENKIPKKYKWKNLIKPILLLSLLGFFTEVPMFLFNLLADKFYHSIYKMGVYSILNPVLVYIFDYCIVKVYFYKHHYLSFGINSLCFLTSLVIDIIHLVIKKVNYLGYYIYMLARILRLIIQCLLYCFSKIEFESSILTPYSIIAFRSIFETIFLGLFSIPFIFIKIKGFGQKDGDGEILFTKFPCFFDGINLLYSIILFIINYLIDISFMLIIDKFSTSHLALAICSESFATNAYHIIKSHINKANVSYETYVNLGLYFLVFIGAMIHNEIFIINKCGLHEKTLLNLNNEFKEENIDIENVVNNLDANSGNSASKESESMEVN